MTACARSGCSNTVEQKSRGRQRRYCSRSCKEMTLRGRTSEAYGHRSSGGGNSTQTFATETTTCEVENGDLQKASLRWIEVNPATHKLTDGLTERTPASHGQWGGFNIERGVAWVMEVGKPFGKVAWYARCGDLSYGPASLENAKHAAMAFAKGAKSFPESGIASSFTGAVNLHADPEVAAEMRKGRA